MDLIKRIKVVELQTHRYCNAEGPHVRLLPPLRTLRIVLNAWCTCSLGIHSEICQEDQSETYLGWPPCPWRTALKTDKVVLTYLSAHNASAVLRGFQNVKSSAGTLTIVIPPDLKYCDPSTGTAIREALEEMRPRPPQLKILVSNFGTRIASMTSFNRLWQKSWPADTTDVLAFLSAAISPEYKTTAYIVDVCFTGCRLSSLVSQPPFVTKEFTDDLIRLLDSNVAGSASITIRSRADYLREGCTDEVDYEERVRWREDQAKEDIEEEFKRFRCQVILEHQSLNTEKHQEAMDLQGPVIDGWFDDWVEKSTYGIRFRRYFDMVRILEREEDAEDLENEYLVEQCSMDIVRAEMRLLEETEIRRQVQETKERYWAERQAMEIQGSEIEKGPIIKHWLNMYEKEGEERRFQSMQEKMIRDQEEYFRDQLIVTKMEMETLALIGSYLDIQMDHMDEASRKMAQPFVMKREILGSTLMARKLLW